jgi:hypothetical protein
MNNNERLEFLERAIKTNLPMKDICAVFECSAEELRKFIKLHKPDLLEAFERTANKIGEPPPERAAHLVQREQQRKLRWRRTVHGRAGTDVVTNSSETSEKLTKREQEFADILRGTERFGDGRPFDRLGEDAREEVERQVSLFMNWQAEKERPAKR